MNHFRFDGYPYFPALRTRSAELKGLQHLAIEQRAAMLPLLTQGRWPRSNDFLRSAERAAEVMQGAPYCLDLTHDGNHLPEAQQQLRNPARGYEAWRQFVARWPQASCSGTLHAAPRTKASKVMCAQPKPSSAQTPTWAPAACGVSK